MTEENEGGISFNDVATTLRTKRGIRLTPGQNNGLGALVENDGKVNITDVTNGADAGRAQGTEPINESILNED